MEKANRMLQDASSTSGSKQAEAVNTAVYIKNRSPITAVKGCMPEEKWAKKKVSVAHYLQYCLSS